MKTWKCGFGWLHKHSSCFPSQCACQQLLHQQGLSLILTFQSPPWTAVCTNLRFYFTGGINRNQFNIQEHCMHLESANWAKARTVIAAPSVTDTSQNCALKVFVSDKANCVHCIRQTTLQNHIYIRGNHGLTQKEQGEQKYAPPALFAHQKLLLDATTRIYWIKSHMHIAPLG